jgi:hypothetical protein
LGDLVCYVLNEELIPTAYEAAPPLFTAPGDQGLTGGRNSANIFT